MFSFYATILQDQRSKGVTAVAIKKEIAYKNNPPGVSSESLSGWEKKRNNMFNISTPNRSSD